MDDLFLILNRAGNHNKRLCITTLQFLSAKSGEITKF
jgi:hypothetical protein